MNDIVAHRGPDDEGFALFSLDHGNQPLTFAGKDSPESILNSNLPYAPKQHFKNHKLLDHYHVAFGHRRLSIIDLSVSGHQPMSDALQRYWITFNGEIYNYIELRRELEDNGYRFLSHTDTEMILYAYHHWGTACLDRFNGMFSFALFDTHEHTLFAARDRFGVKPLYYWVSPQGFLALASEIKQFTTLPGWQARVNGQAAYDFLNWGMTNHTPETCFKGVYQVPPGHFIQAKLYKSAFFPKPIRWYQLPVHSFRGSLSSASENFAFLLKDAVRLRCRADVPVGSCLSGGLDSSSIVCLMNQVLREQASSHQQMTFSACSHIKRFDESEFIQQVIAQTGVKAFTTYPDLQNLIHDLDSILWHQDEPFGSTSIFAQWEVFKLVKTQNVKVMLDGQGADEQLAGYSGFHAARFADLAKNFRFLKLSHEMKRCEELHQLSFPAKLLLNQILPEWIRQPIRRQLKKPSNYAPWINTDLLEAIQLDPHQIETPVEGVLQSQCYAQITRTNLPMLLHFEDRDSMAHSIEARTPFLDYRLVEFIMSLPADYKLSDGISKVVLREGMRGILPEGIRTRISKLGFATPEEVWMREQNPQLFRELARDSIQASNGILNHKALEIADDVISGKIPFSNLPWRVLIFGKWVKRFRLS